MMEMMLLDSQHQDLMRPNFALDAKSMEDCTGYLLGTVKHMIWGFFPNKADKRVDVRIQKDQNRHA